VAKSGFYNHETAAVSETTKTDVTTAKCFEKEKKKKKKKAR